MSSNWAESGPGAFAPWRCIDGDPGDDLGAGANDCPIWSYDTICATGHRAVEKCMDIKRNENPMIENPMIGCENWISVRVGEAVNIGYVAVYNRRDCPFTMRWCVLPRINALCC